MVFIGGWRTPRPGPYGPYGQRGYGYGGGNSCMRDVCLVESGCCLAEMLGCGPQFTLLAPVLASRSVRAAWRAAPDEATTGTRTTGTSRSVRFLGKAIRLYQQEISAKRRHACCRYFPSCSVYTLEALEVHGLTRGLLLGGRRLLRCRPGSSGGYDPVPPPR